MNYALRLLIVLAMIILVCGAASSLQVPMSKQYDLSLDVVCKPEVGDWDGPAATAVGGAFVALSSGGYRLQVVPSSEGPARLELSRDRGSAFVVERVTATVRLPLEGIVAEWDTQVPPFGTMFRRAPELEFEIATRANVGIPLVVLVDAHGNSRLSAGFIEQSENCTIAGERSGSDYLLTLTRLAGDAEAPATQFASTMYISQDRDYWFDAVRAYAKTVDKHIGYRPKPIPKSAYEPTYSTCYAYSDDIDSDIVWRSAVEARRLGMGQILIDVGWSNDLSWADSKNDYGAYEPSARKFPDFSGLVKRIHNELGMRVILWISPTWIGEQSKHYDQVKDYRVKWPDGDYDRNLCPRSAGAREYLAEKLKDLAREHRIDGFWIDFLDTCPTVCDAPHAHDAADFGDALNLMLADIYGALASVNRNATVEYRVPYANLYTKPHANVFETTDAPNDFHANRLMGTFVRAFGDGVVVKGDPAYWENDVHHEEVARHCMTSIMLGVPAFSVDLLRMDDGRKQQIKAWLDFYNANREDLLNGTFRPFGASFHFPDLKIVSDKQAFVYLSTRKTKVIPIEKPVSVLHIMNVNPPEHGQLRLTVEGLADGEYVGRYYDCSMHSDRQEQFECKGGRMPLNTDMPTGGMLTLTRQ